MSSSAPSTSGPIRRLLASRIAGMKESPTVALNDIANKLIKQNKKVFKFGIGQSPFPVPQCIINALKANAHQKDYLPAQGLLKLRESIAEYHNQKSKLFYNKSNDYTSSDVIIGPGTKELAFFLQVAYYGDLVLQTPCWLSYIPQSNMIGRNIRIIRSKYRKNWKITPKQLREHCEFEGPDKPRILILNYPSNPTGMTFTNEELSNLADVCREYRIIVLSDEIYSSFDFSGDYKSISMYYPEGTIILDGMSKRNGAGGYRLGHFVFPKNLQWLLVGIKNCASETFTSVSAPLQYAALEAYDNHFENKEIQEYIHNAREILSKVSTLCVDGLRSYNIDVYKPDGGFYLFPGFSNTKKGIELKDKINDKDSYEQNMVVDKFFQDCLMGSGVSVISGHYFGTRPSSLFFRLSYVDFDGKAALENPENMKVYDKMLFGVETLGKYLNV